MQHPSTVMCTSLAPMDLWRSRSLNRNTNMARGQRKGLGGRLEHGNSRTVCKRHYRAVRESHALYITLVLSGHSGFQTTSNSL